MEAKRGEGNCSGRFQNVPSRNAAVLGGRTEGRRGEAVSAYVFPEKELVGRLEDDGTTGTMVPRRRKEKVREEPRKNVDNVGKT